MEKNCGTCRFKVGGSCVKFTIAVNENFKACNDYAEKMEVNENCSQKIQLND